MSAIISMADMTGVMFDCVVGRFEIQRSWKITKPQLIKMSLSVLFKWVLYINVIEKCQWVNIAPLKVKKNLFIYGVHSTIFDRL